MWVGRETRQRILGHEISPYPEVVRGRELQLTTRPSRGQLRLDSREAISRQLVAGQQRGQLPAGQQRGKQQKAVGVEERTGAVNTRHRSREARQHGIGSSESESR